MKTDGARTSVTQVSPRQLKMQRDSKTSMVFDALSLSVGLTNRIFMVLFFSASYYLMRRWRDKITTSTPLHMLNLGEIAALTAQLASFVYLIGFFGVDYLQTYISKSGDAPFWNVTHP